MPRFVLLVVAVVVALVAPGSVRAQVDSATVIADVDAFWATAFANAGVDYGPPLSVAVEGSITTDCGPIDPAWGPGAYCPLDQTVYYAPVWFAQFQASGNDYAFTTVIAHEWGHHVQLQLGLWSGPSKETELQADCLAGAYIGDAEARGLITSGAFAEAVRLAALSGDLPWLPQHAPEHGSGAERAVAFMNGYQQGVSGCGIGI